MSDDIIPASTRLQNLAIDIDGNSPDRQHRLWHLLFWAPTWCRWDTDNPPPFTIWLNILYGFAGGFTSANLAYSLPILNVLADSFKTSQAGVANIPTLAQAGNVTGLLFILPFADFFPRRRFVLFLVALTALIWYATSRYKYDHDLVMPLTSSTGSVFASLATSQPSSHSPISQRSSQELLRSCCRLWPSYLPQRNVLSTFPLSAPDLRWESCWHASCLVSSLTSLLGVTSTG